MKKNRRKVKMYRSDTARGVSLEAGAVDREAETISGYAVMTRGPIESHGLEADDETLERVVELGNRTKIGVKSRFGHPNMSGKALGTFLGRARSFRIDGDVVRADLHLDATSHTTPEGDLGAYTLDLAESDPGAFGSSLVLDGEVEYRLDDDGARAKDEAGEDLPPLLRPDRVFASDVVDEPAANSGFFEALQFTGDVSLAASATQFLDVLLEDAEALEKVLGFLGRYSTRKPPTKEETMDPREDAADLDAVRREARTEAIEAERARISSIRDAAFSGQDALLSELIKDGVSVPDALSRLIEDQKHRDADRLTSLERDASAALTSAAPEEAELEAAPEALEESPLVDGAYQEEHAAEHFARLNSEQKRNYGDADAYCGYWSAKAAGKTHRFHSVENVALLD